MDEIKKTLEQLNFPDDRFYHQEHTWAKVEENLVIVGITDYAQDQLGEIIFVELPSEGEEFAQGDIFGQAESAKTVSSLYMPISGKVIAINDEIEDHLEYINEDPYNAGWLLKIEPTQTNELEQALSKDGYLNGLKEIIK